MNDARRDNGSVINDGHSFKCSVENDWNSISSDVLELEEIIFEPELRYTVDDFVEEFHIPGSCFILSRYEGLPAGYLHAVQLDNLDYLSYDPEFGKKTTMYIVNIALLPQYRKREFAVQMFEFLMKSIPMKRFSAHAVNESSRKFFHRIGFKERGIFRSWMNGIDAIYLVREDIDSGDPCKAGGESF